MAKKTNEFDVNDPMSGAASSDAEYEEGHIDPTEAEPAVSRTALTLYSDQPEFNADDVYVPRLRIIQSMSQEVRDGLKVGQWIMTGEEPKSVVTVIVLKMHRRRELRDKQSFELFCSSNDTLIGVGDPGGECERCPMNQWVRDDRGKNAPPQCTFIYSYLVYVKGAGLAIVDFKRTSINAGKMINTLIAQKGFAKFVVDLGISEQPGKGKQGAFYTPVVRTVPVDKDLINEAVEAVKMA